MTRHGRPAAVMLALGVLVGVVWAALWARLAPGVRYQVFDNQSWAPLPTETQHIFISFGIFAVLGLFIGGGLAAVGWMFRDQRGAVQLVLCALAATVASVLARTLGLAWAAGTDPASVAAVAGVQEIVAAPAVLTGWPALLAAPTAAVIVYTFLVSWSGVENLGGMPITLDT